jgi:hypothetical protein
MRKRKRKCGMFLPMTVPSELTCKNSTKASS